MWNPPTSRSHRVIGWGSGALLGVLLMVPAELAARERERGDRAESPRVSSSKPSAPKASPPSRSAPRSQPRASSSSRSSRSQPRARTQSKPRRSESVSRSTSSRRSRVAEPRKLDRDAYPRSNHRQQINKPSPNRGSATPRLESAPVARTVPAPRQAPPRQATPQAPRQLDREEDLPRRKWSDRPRYQTPAERSPVNPSTATESGGIQRRGPYKGDGRRNLEIDLEREDPGSSSTRRRRQHRDDHDHYRDGHDHHGHDRGYGGHRRHRHRYGCGHYGYGYYDPYRYSYNYRYYSPSIYWGRGYYRPGVHVYVDGASSRGGYSGLGQGALDLDIKPEDAEIYIDGSYIGVADQYDGFPNYLWLEEGTYEIAFYKEGFETIYRQYTIYPGVTIDVRDKMRRGESERPDRVAPQAEQLPAIAPQQSSGVPQPPSNAPQAPANAPEPPSVPEDMGRIAIAATPGDAAVYLDSHFVGTAAEVADLSAGLIVESGAHVIEIIRPGYENQEIPVELAAGERIDLKLDLKQP